MSVLETMSCQRGNDGQGHAGMYGRGHGWGRAWICKYVVIFYKKSSPITRSAQLQASWPSSWPIMGHAMPGHA
jgi:predicted glutamine amidotransferase